MTKRLLLAALLGSGAIMALPACSTEQAESAEQGRTAVREAAASDTAYASQNAALMALAERHARTVLERAPEAATSLGVSTDIGGEGYGARLRDYSPLARDEALELNDQFLRDLQGIDREALSGTALVTYDVLLNAYETAAARNQYDFGGGAVLGSNPPYIVTQLSGPHIELPRLLLTEQPLTTPQEARDYIARLREIGRALAETRDSLLLDAERGVVPPVFALTGAAGSIETLTEAPAGEHPLVTHFRSGLSGIGDLSAEERGRLAQDAEAAVERVVYPAYADLREALLSLRDAAGQDAGVWRLDGGAAFYQHALDSYGASGMTAAEVHELGLSEVERISAEMNAIFEEMGITGGTAGERFQQLAEDPR